MQREYFHHIEVPMPQGLSIILNSRKFKDIMGGLTQNVTHMYYLRALQGLWALLNSVVCVLILVLTYC